MKCEKCGKEVYSGYPNYCPYCGEQFPVHSLVKHHFSRIIESSKMKYSYDDVKIYAMDDAARKCEIGDLVNFKSEPENEHDPNAIAVYFNDNQIGYIYRGKIQDMINDYIKKEFYILAAVVQNIISENTIVIAIAFYKPVTDDEIIKSFTINLSESKYEKIMEECCFMLPVGEEVSVEFDFDKARYTVEQFGLLPKRLDEYAEGSEYCFFLQGEEENDNGGITLKFGIVHI